MIFPPCLLRIKIENREHHISLWIPLILIWIVLGIPVLALALAFLIVVLIFWYFNPGWNLLKGGLAFYRVLCALRELKVDFNHGKEKVLLYFK